MDSIMLPFPHCSSNPSFYFATPLQKTETQNNGAICHPAREDYFECLHNRREHEIVRTVNAEEQKQKNAPAHGGGDGGGH